MINHRKRLFSFLVVAVAATGSFALANAQTPGAGGVGAPPPATGTAGQTPGVDGPNAIPEVSVVPTGVGGSSGTVAVPPVDDVPPGEALGTEETPEKTNVESPLGVPGAHTGSAVPLVFPSTGVTRQRRVKALRTTVGLEPTAPDFGGEADLVSVLNEGSANIKPKRWTFTMHGYLRAPLRVGIGPGNVPSGAIAYTPPDYQLHAPATHVVGVDSNDWRSVGLNPTPTGSLYMSVGNALVSGTIVVSAQTFYDVGYKKLSDMGTISQAYLTMKFNDAFGYRGGLALTAGAFSNRYGLAGPKQQSSGYYNTYLFGRTRVAGANVTANVDLTDRVELVVEGGLGAKIEVIPWLPIPVGPAPYLPEQGPAPQGSNFVWQFHPALFVDEWLKVAAHYMTSYTPNDNWSGIANATTGKPPSSSRMNVLGAEVHVDRPRLGSAYLGYSHVDASAVLSLADGIQLLHSTNGYALTRNYFNPGYAAPQGATVTAVVPGTVGDSGQIDTVLFQYMVRMAPLLELPATGRDLTLAVYGMFNHVTAAMLGGGKQDKLKFGAEAEYAFWRYLSAGVRFDHVRPDGGKADVAYSAVSPRLIFHSSWISREYILLSYTRYFLGSSYGPFLDPPGISNPTYAYDRNLLVLSAQIAF